MTYLGLHLNRLVYPPGHDLWTTATDIARTAEDAGFDGIWVLDHVVQGGHAGTPAEPLPEAYTVLAALASLTSTVELGALVTPVTFRSAAVLAKMVTTLDVVSRGRAVLGLGAGWNEPEHAAYGLGFPSLGVRHDILEEVVQACRLMFTETSPTFTGRHVQLSAATNLPRPVRPTGPPILVGGNGEKRALRTVARYADRCCLPKHTPPSSVRRKLSILDRHCEEAGRDPAEVLRLRKRAMIIDADARTAERLAAEVRERWGESPEVFAGMVYVGTPDQVAEQFAGDLAMGFDGVIIDVERDYETDRVRLAADALRSVRPQRLRRLHLAAGDTVRTTKITAARTIRRLRDRGRTES